MAVFIDTMIDVLTPKGLRDIEDAFRALESQNATIVQKIKTAPATLTAEEREIARLLFDLRTNIQRAKENEFKRLLGIE